MAHNFDIALTVLISLDAVAAVLLAVKLWKLTEKEN